jgi:hypothetical protein
MARKNAKQTQLINNQELPFDTPELPARGTVYRDTCRQISALTKAGKIDADETAGTIAQARSLAAVIDRASGLGGRKQETYALAGLHKQLAELLARLSGGGVGEDAAATFLRLMAEDEPTPAGEPLPAPPALEVAAG